MIRMAISSDPREELVIIQHELLSSLKTSHHLFMQKFQFETVTSLSAILIFIVGEIFFCVVIPGSYGSTFLIGFISVAMFAILSGIRIKKSLSFLRWSKLRLEEIDKSVTHSQVISGLPFYINQLFTAAFAGTLVRDPVDETPEGVLAEIQRQYHRGKVTFIIVILLVVPIISWMAWAIWSASVVDFQQAFLLLFLCGLLGLFVGIFTLDKKWARSVHQWAGYYAALDRWGNDLEKLLSKRKNGSL